MIIMGKWTAFMAVMIAAILTITVCLSLISTGASIILIVLNLFMGFTKFSSLIVMFIGSLITFLLSVTAAAVIGGDA